eukprot:5636892-Pleurochrysis_carterae.AAC.1
MSHYPSPCPVPAALSAGALFWWKPSRYALRAHSLGSISRHDFIIFNDFLCLSYICLGSIATTVADAAVYLQSTQFRAALASSRTPSLRCASNFVTPCTASEPLQQPSGNLQPIA